MFGQYTLDLLFSEEDAWLHRRPRKGRLFADPQQMLTWYREPYLALAASILIISIEDLDKPLRAGEAKEFFSSAWCKEILGGLNVEPNRFFRLLQQSDCGEGFQILENVNSN